MWSGLNSQYITTTIDDHVAILRLNRPEALNALNGALSQELNQALKLIRSNPEARALILTGDSKAFAAGADVKEMAGATPQEAREFCGLAVENNNLFESLPIPTIAAISGFAFGGGFEMALACDFRVGSPNTKLMFPEVNLGIIPGANGCARITALVGPSKAKELVMLTPMISGEEAYMLGILTHFIEQDEQVFEEAQRLAKILLSKPACALAAAKTAINTAALETISAGKSAETTEFSFLFNTHDQKEGMAAMLEKRKAVFMNR